MANDFKVGDVVQLKSGSMPMTVTNVKQDIIECKWFNSAKDLPEGLSFGTNASNATVKFNFHQIGAIGAAEFPPDALEKVQKP